MSGLREMGTRYDPSAFTQADEEEDRIAKIRKKILFAMSITPAVGHTQMQACLGYSIPARDWKPVMDALIKEGIVVKEELSLTSPFGQFREYTRLRLACVPLPTPEFIYNSFCS